MADKSKVTIITYFSPEMVEWMDRFVYNKKMEGDRSYSRNKLINEAVKLFRDSVKLSEENQE